MWNWLIVASLAGEPALQDTLDRHNAARRRDQIQGMSVLLGWSVANIGVGAVGWGVADDPTWVAFHQMNLAWNGVNLALAIPGLVGGLRESPDGMALAPTLRASAGMRTTFAFNAGLDVGWVALGVWLHERGLRLEDPRSIGFGRSMMMQGAFLLAFDATMWLLRSDRDRRLFLAPALGSAPGVQIGGAW